MTKEMLWFLMGQLVCIGQWAAFIMVDHAFLGLSLIHISEPTRRS